MKCVILWCTYTYISGIVHTLHYFSRASASWHLHWLFPWLMYKSVSYLVKLCYATYLLCYVWLHSSVVLDASYIIYQILILWCMEFFIKVTLSRIYLCMHLWLHIVADLYHRTCTIVIHLLICYKNYIFLFVLIYLHIMK